MENSLVRFDDRLATLLDQPLPSDSAKASAWAQLIDYVAQRGAGTANLTRARLLSRIDELSHNVPVIRRAAVASAVASPNAHADVVAIFGRDIGIIASRLLPVARLAEGEWLELIPLLPSSSRTLLRGRQDLSLAVTQMLGRYSHADHTLTDSSPETPEIDKPAPTPIQELVDRIEAFQRKRTDSIAVADAPALAVKKVAQAFRFECDRDGLINWVEGAARGALIGLSIAEMASPGMSGVDGHAAGAFRQRSAFTKARLLVPGSGDAGGHWLISGNPLFRQDDGRFVGYRGNARRPAAHEHLNADQSAVAVATVSQDSLRHLSHELRTPINAVAGFSAMIESQVLGPVASSYRAKARAIMIDAARLVDVLDDTEAGRMGRTGNVDLCDPVTLITQVHAEMEPRADAKEVTLRFELLRDAAPIGVVADLAHRLCSRIVACLILMASAGDEIAVGLGRVGDRIVLTASTPRAFASADRKAFLDPEVAISSDVAQSGRMEAAFTFRQVEALAKAAGVELKIGDGEVTLGFPIAAVSNVDTGRGKGRL
jgi:His Kinase A (phospho-acceptor) domain